MCFRLASSVVSFYELLSKEQHGWQREVGAVMRVGMYAKMHLDHFAASGKWMGFADNADRFTLAKAMINNEPVWVRDRRMTPRSLCLT